MQDSSDKKSRGSLPDNKQTNNDDVDCPCYINSPEHNNCFWEYVRAKSSVDGSMPEHVQSEIAQLFNWSNTKTHFMLKQAVTELIEALNKYRAKQLLSGDNPNATANFNSFGIDPVINYSESSEE